MAWWALAAASAALGVVSAVADWKRIRRRDLDRPGWVPWATVQILALLATLAAVGLALHQ
jgi:hypothetical protein